MATISLRAIEVVKTIHGNSPWTLSIPEAASQTYKRGAILTLNGSGHVVEASADPSWIVGIAAEDGHNDSVAATHEAKVWIADDETIFVANKLTSGAVSATANTDRGHNFGVVKVGNNWHLETDLATHPRRALVCDLDRRDAVGDLGGRLHFMFIGAFRAFEATS